MKRITKNILASATVAALLIEPSIPLELVGFSTESSVAHAEIGRPLTIF